MMGPIDVWLGLLVLCIIMVLLGLRKIRRDAAIRAEADEAIDIWESM